MNESSERIAAEDEREEQPFLAELSDSFPVEADFADETEPPPRRRRRVKLPLLLFGLTCISTFWVGAAQWAPDLILIRSFLYGPVDLMPIRRTLISHWDEGLIYMLLLLGILMAHELGHFFATIWHRVPASLPIFLPFPINPLGTLGAVIAMDGKRADRRQIFDIGLAGPLAGLVFALPVMWIGISQLDLTSQLEGRIGLGSPLAVRMMMSAIQPPGFERGEWVWIREVNPFFMAGWVGLFVTGLNMLPVSQLDGGHVTYALFGKSAHWIARILMVAAIAFIVYSAVIPLILMAVLVLLIGTDHPPTRNDSARLGWFRIVLGCLSLAIPILCFAPVPFLVPSL